MYKGVLVLWIKKDSASKLKSKIEKNKIYFLPKKKKDASKIEKFCEDRKISIPQLRKQKAKTDKTSEKTRQTRTLSFLFFS